MKALPIQQPWAWLIVNAASYPDPKLIENRRWMTSFRGTFLVHAGKKFDKEGYRHILEVRPDLARVMPQPGHFELGGFVGVAKVVDCLPWTAAAAQRSAWFVGDYGFVLEEHPRPLPFVPFTSALGFFEVDEIGMLLHPDYAPLVQSPAP
ncbi:hypothetical protein [Noviherbaspirillum sp.]|uniref:hypothetical protein n=1 Tax=Noviherbaspirillum sp. TaxID=1926288 RepID=UPI002D68EF31|nr:hypothetical protein [Noviherbaspirillum sp.]HZW21770.1 hypothetical protein [Noviherbaspirillum sp.]